MAEKFGGRSFLIPRGAQIDADLLNGLRPSQYLRSDVADTFGADLTVGGDVLPETDNTYDLGSAAASWADAHFDGTVTAANVSVSTDLTLGASARVGSDLIPDTDDTHDLGSATLEWKDIYIDGVAYLDTVNVGDVATDLLPDVTATHDLGSSSKYWKDLYLSGNLYGDTSSVSVDMPVSFDMFIEENAQNLDENAHGDLLSLATSQTLNSGSPVAVTTGIGKLMIHVSAGSDTSGTITITGTSVDREDASETGSDTDNITISGTSTDGSDTDAQSNTRHSFTGAYISSKWFKGAVTISTSDVDCTIDVYHLSFEQVNDAANFTLRTLDLNALATNTSAWLYVYLYAVNVTGSTVDITREASLELPAADVTANRYYRRRIGNIDKALVGTNDGFWVDVHLGPAALTYWESVTLKVWADVTKQISAAVPAVGPFTADLIPDTDDAYDIGSDSFKVKDVYAGRFLGGSSQSWNAGHQGTLADGSYQPIKGAGNADASTLAGYVARRSGSVVGLTVRHKTADSEDASYKVYKNGAALSAAITITGSSLDQYASWAPGTYTFAAGDRLWVYGLFSALGTGHDSIYATWDVIYDEV